MSLFILLTAVATATVPIAPSFPGCGNPETPELCPPDLEEDWALINYIPENALLSVREAELELGSGIAANAAWEVTTGRWDVLLAVADSGVEWGQGDIVNKLFINIGELPEPICEDGELGVEHDCDGNGLVNIQDWAHDPRVDQTAGRDKFDELWPLSFPDLRVAFVVTSTARNWASLGNSPKRLAR